jgi:ribosomal protein L29
MELKDLTQKNASELRVLLAETRERLRDLRFRVSQEAHKDVREIREVRTAIARILTLLRQGSGGQAHLTKKDKQPS